MNTKTNNESVNGWKSHLSFIHLENKPKLRYAGKYRLQGMQFKFSLNEQTGGPYLMRGTVSFTLPSDSGKKTLSMSVSCNSRDVEDIKAAVARTASNLYIKHQSEIIRVLKKAVQPESIAPNVAAHLFAEEFVRNVYSKNTEETQKRKIAIIKKLFIDLPDKPMIQYDLKMISSFIKEKEISADNQKLLAEFWTWVIQKLHLNQACPFPLPPKKRVSPKTSQMRASIPDELDLSMQDKLFDRLHHAPPGAKCGIALMLWGGVSASYAVSCLWSDVLFHGGNVLLLIRRDELTGATHDYRRPLFPQAAILLKERYQELLEKFSKEQIEKMPIVSQKMNAERAMKTNELHQTSRTILRSIGVSDAAFQAWKTHKFAVTSRLFTRTYQKNISMNCGFGPYNHGIMNFLMGRSLAGDTTSCNYTSFICKESLERTVTAMAPLGPLEKIEPVTEQEKLPNGTVQYSFAPKTNRETIHIIGALTIPPGGSIDIRCNHGVEGSVSIRELTPDGKKRRAPSKKKHAG